MIHKVAMDEQNKIELKMPFTNLNSNKHYLYERETSLTLALKTYCFLVKKSIINEISSFITKHFTCLKNI